MLLLETEHAARGSGLVLGAAGKQQHLQCFDVPQQHRSLIQGCGAYFYVLVYIYRYFEKGMLMYNYYDYEANLPVDKASYKGLYNDYFHDSPITSMNIWPEKHSLEMQIQCRRECEEETGDPYKDVLDEKYGYALTFSGVSYLEINTTLQGCEFINGRFKAIPKGKYYYRIQTTDGYMDIGYRSFMLRKRIGRLSYKGIVQFDPWMDKLWLTPEEKIISILKRLADHGYTEEQEFDLYLDLQRLYSSKASGIAPYLRRIAASGWESEDAAPFAAWLLGKFGDSDDIPLLCQLQGRANCTMVKKNLSDAIEALSNRRFVTTGE